MHTHTYYIVWMRPTNRDSAAAVCKYILEAKVTNTYTHHNYALTYIYTKTTHTNMCQIASKSFAAAQMHADCTDEQFFLSQTESFVPIQGLIMQSYREYLIK